MSNDINTKIYKRSAATTIFQRLQENRKFIQVIIGPRQVGKTTVIHQTLEVSTNQNFGNRRRWNAAI